MPYVVIASGTVDSPNWGLISPVTVPASQTYICEPSQYPPSALSVSGSNTGPIAAGPLSKYPYNYPQCNDTAAIDYLANQTDAANDNPTVCNHDLIAWLISNLGGAYADVIQ